MLIGAAVKEAAAKGVCLTPVFSLYSFHGPVFRVMLRAQQGREWPVQHYGFVGYCHVHGNTYNVDWKHLSSATCRCVRVCVCVCCSLPALHCADQPHYGNALGWATERH